MRKQTRRLLRTIGAAHAISTAAAQTPDCLVRSYPTCLDRSGGDFDDVAPIVHDFREPHTAHGEEIVSGPMWLSLLQDDTEVTCESAREMEALLLSYLADNIGGEGFEPVCVQIADVAYDAQLLPGGMEMRWSPRDGEPASLGKLVIGPSIVKQKVKGTSSLAQRNHHRPKNKRAHKGRRPHKGPRGGGRRLAGADRGGEADEAPIAEASDPDAARRAQGVELVESNTLRLIVSYVDKAGPVESVSVASVSSVSVSSTDVSSSTRVSSTSPSRSRSRGLRRGGKGGGKDTRTGDEGEGGRALQVQCTRFERYQCCSQNTINGNPGAYCQGLGCNIRDCGTGRRRGRRGLVSAGDAGGHNVTALSSSIETGRRLHPPPCSLKGEYSACAVREYTEFHPEDLRAHLDSESIGAVASCSTNRYGLKKYGTPTLDCDEFNAIDCFRNDDSLPPLSEDGGCLAGSVM